jgi:hypothetical protein
VPVEVGVGDAVTGATVNAGGRLVVEATRVVSAVGPELRNCLPQRTRPGRRVPPHIDHQPDPRPNPSG